MFSRSPSRRRKSRLRSRSSSVFTSARDEGFTPARRYQIHQLTVQAGQQPCVVEWQLTIIDNLAKTVRCGAYLDGEAQSAQARRYP